MRREFWRLEPQGYDIILFGLIVVLTGFGLLMMTSASMVVADKMFHAPFYFFYRQLFFVVIGFIAMVVMMHIPFSFWQRISPLFYMASVCLLLLVLLPGVGHSVNGSQRWVSLGVVKIQVAEFVKWFFVLYLASYLERFRDNMDEWKVSVIKPFLLLSVLAGLMLCQPDFGSAVVLAMTCGILLFAAGMRLSIVMVVLVVGVVAFSGLAIFSPYRLLRLTSFMNPWQSPFGSGYQLTQSLMAFGRGGFWGVGLGDSVQKLFYLPEAHTDFVVAVLAEELGCMGVLVLLALFIVLVGRLLWIVRQALDKNCYMQAYLVLGVACLLSLQVFINMGVNMGLLPTKGITLPFMSYGGSSFLSVCMMLGLCGRAYYEVVHVVAQVPMRRFREEA